MKCPRTVMDGKQHCGWEGDDPTEHADVHSLCICSNITHPHFLRDTDIRACSRCVTGALTDLEEIVEAYATLPSVVEASGYRMRGLPGGNALVMLAHGAVEGGGPDDDIRYHDPVPVLANLHSWERDWRETFGHDRFPAWRATVVNTVGYLTEWMWLAARTHDGYDDYVRDIRTLRSRLTHVAGLANDPDRLPAECVDCHHDLLREYRPPKANPVTTRKGHEDEGRADDATCRGCGRVYKPADYGWALITRAASCSGWVTVKMAAETSRRPEQTIWRWVRESTAESTVAPACRISDRRVVVEWELVKARSDESGRRNHDKGEAA